MKNKEIPMSETSFKSMARMFKIRDLFFNPRHILKEAGVKEGMNILDYGCGPGSFSIAAAKIIGEKGTIYAVDIHPLAIESVKKTSERLGFKNIRTIKTDCNTKIEEKSVDIALLFDIYHGLKYPKNILKEIHRVLKPNGILAFDDHHVKEQSGLVSLTSSGLFKFKKKGKKIFILTKI